MISSLRPGWVAFLPPGLLLSLVRAGADRSPSLRWGALYFGMQRVNQGQRAPQRAHG